MRGDVGPRPLVALGLASFIVLYLWVVMIAFDDQPRASRPTFVLLAGMSTIGVSLAAGYGDRPSGWLSPLLYVAVAGAATIRTPRKVAGWLIGTAVVAVTIGLRYGLSVDDIGSTVFSAFMAGALVYVVRQMIELIRQLRQTQRELAEAAVAQERLRFSRDLHDLLGHTLSLMVVKAELTRRLAPRDPVAAAQEAGDIETIGRKALVEVREAVTGYRERTPGARTRRRPSRPGRRRDRGHHPGSGVDAATPSERRPGLDRTRGDHQCDPPQWSDPMRHRRAGQRRHRHPGDRRQWIASPGPAPATVCAVSVNASRPWAAHCSRPPTPAAASASSPNSPPPPSPTGVGDSIGTPAV